MTVTSSQTISSLGTVYFAGTLKIIVSNDSLINRTVTPFQYNASSGQFANVEVEAQNQGSGCTTDGAAVVYGPHSLSVLITQFCTSNGDGKGDGGGGGGVNKNLVIGVVVGVAGCFILSCIIIAVVGGVIALITSFSLHL